MRKRGLLESSPECPVECLKLKRLSDACLLGFWLFARTNSQIRQDIPSETSIRPATTTIRAYNPHFRSLCNKHTITLHISHFVYYTSLHPSFFPTSLSSLPISFSLSPNFPSCFTVISVL